MYIINVIKQRTVPENHEIIGSKSMKEAIITLGKTDFSLDVTITEARGNIIPMNYTGTDSAGNMIFTALHNDIHTVSLTLSVKRGAGADSLFVNFDIESHVWYDVHATVAPIDPIKIRLTPKEATGTVLSSVFHIGEKSDCWTTPHFSDRLGDFPTRAVMLLWQRDGIYRQMMPLSDGDFKSEFYPDGDSLIVTVSPYCGGYSHIEANVLAFGYGEDPYEVSRRTVEWGFICMGRAVATADRTRLDDMFDYLGWCSWDSMGLNVNEEGMYEKAKEFLDKNIPVRWFLLDDGWYPEDERRRALSFTANEKKFPHGLGYFVSKLKSEYGLDKVGIWECFSGGWLGIAPGSELDMNYGECFEKLPNGVIFPRTDMGGAYEYWNMRHKPLSDCGFDFVKVDVECNMETCTSGAKPIGRVAENMLSALEASVGLYFDGRCINCTGMGQECLWNRRVGMVNRNSEDFNPQNPETMHAFIRANVYNSFWHSNFCATDWDMMWSESPTTRQNVVLHTVSGGPVYLSDPHGISNRDAIMPLVMSDGYVLKCDGYARPTIDRLLVCAEKEKKAIKAYNTANGCGVIALFNTCDENISDKVSPRDAHDVAGDKFLVWDVFAKSARVCCPDDDIDVRLPLYDVKLYITVPYIGGIAVLGNTDKYISPKTISEEISSDTLGRTFILYEGGPFTFACDGEFCMFVNGEKFDKVRVLDGSIPVYEADISDIKDKVVVRILRK